MKHFIVIISYTALLDRIDEVLPQHREFLSSGYEKGILLMSGPQNPRTGGIVVARGENSEEIKRFFDNDPYKLNGLAVYDFIEFNPVKHQDFIKEWAAG
jgi:uncharacterized protein YciI